MIATKFLPGQYILHYSLDLSNRKAVLILNLAGVFLFFAMGWFFGWVATAVRPEFYLHNVTIDLRSAVLNLFLVTLVIFTVLILHELTHGLFFWIFTRERPIFAFKGAYAYAAAPAWYIPRNPYLLIGFAPFGLISLIGIVGFWILPLGTLPYLLLAVTFNAAGAIGDLVVIGLLLSQPTLALVQDAGDIFKIYRLQTPSV